MPKRNHPSPARSGCRYGAAWILSLAALVSTAGCSQEDPATSTPTSALVPAADSGLRLRGPFHPLAREGDSVARSQLTGPADGVLSHQVQAGQGPTPVRGSTVHLHHTAWLTDGDRVGKEIADSRAHRRPEAFLLEAWAASPSELPTAPAFALERPPQALGLPGLVDAVARMRKGERRWFRVPAQQAYGAQGLRWLTGGSDTSATPEREIVPPDADLFFDIELVDYGAR